MGAKLLKKRKMKDVVRYNKFQSLIDTQRKRLSTRHNQIITLEFQLISLKSVILDTFAIVAIVLFPIIFFKSYGLFSVIAILIGAAIFIVKFIVNYSNAIQASKKIDVIEQEIDDIEYNIHLLSKKQRRFCYS